MKRVNNTKDKIVCLKKITTGAVLAVVFLPSIANAIPAPVLVPAAATLISPSGSISDTTPTYEWNAVSNATWYRLWVDDSTGHKIGTWHAAASVGCGSGTGTCSITPATTLAYGAGKWWIQTYNTSGSTWSSSLSFTVLSAGGSGSGNVDMSNCPSVTLRVDDISTATGWGSHFSAGSSENGYGGSNFECHLTPSSSGLVALCYDAVHNATNRTNQFSAYLGPKEDIDFVEWNVGENGVRVTAQRRSKSAYTSKRIPFQSSAYFPIHPDIGACGVDNTDTTNTLYWVANGVLSGMASRTGSGYSMSVITP